MRKLPLIVFCAIIGLSLTAFQNCGSDFNPEEYAEQSSLSGGQPSNPVDTIPVITSSTPNTTISAGQSVAISVGAQGTNLSYTWYKNNVVIPGAAQPSYSIGTSVTGDSGTYRVVVSNAAGSASAEMVLTVNAVVPPVTAPVITSQPASASMALVVSGGFPNISVYWNPAAVTLNVAASGSGLSYQWYFDPADIPNQPVMGERALTGSVGSAYQVSSVANGATRPLNEFCGKYRVVIANSSGSVSSSVATIACTAGTTTYY